ncbi:trihelix transcription factor ASR3-like [Coffea arabica]|uniref:Trihelix transcription factor ASR3-like n=1 Tax=Coffea arabica TaxID=13443 RepID=A0ABM4VQN3_COFAR
MAPGPNDRLEKATSSASVLDEEHQAVERTSSENKSTRHPRWTKQETLILIEGKNIAESQGRKGRRSSSIFVTGQHEPKWDSVSSYCRLHGVNRGPVQCRKRWSNLVSDFKKIRTWESQVKEEGESFWMMRNDLRREKKLPGHFDRQVYAVLNGNSYQAVMGMSVDGREADGTCVADTEDEDEEDVNRGIETGVVFDSGTHARPETLISHLEKCAQGKIFRGPNVQVARESPRSNSPTPMPLSGPAKGKQPGPHFWTRRVSQEDVKRRRLSLDKCEDFNLSQHLIKVLERNNRVLNAQLETQRMNSQLDREQQKAHTDILSSALSKICDAFSRIADKF